MKDDEMSVSIGKLIDEIANAYDPAKKEEYVDTFKGLFDKDTVEEKERRKELGNALGVVDDGTDDMTEEELFKHKLGLKEQSEAK